MGAPLHISLFGTSGIGKSALLREFANRAEAKGAWVFMGRSNQRESMPFKAVDPIVDAIGRRLAQLAEADAARLLPRNIKALTALFPAFGRIPAVAAMPAARGLALTPGEIQAAAAEALADLLTAMADRSPVALVLDDFQWGDSESVSFIRMLFFGDDPPPVLLLIAAREEERGAPVIRQLEFSGMRVNSRPMTLPPLGEDDCAALARAWLGEIDTGDVAQLAAGAHGSPFFVEQLARLHRDGSLLAGEVPELRGLVEKRLERLGSGSRLALATLAVAGRPLPIRTLSRVLDQAKGTTLDAVIALSREGLARRVGEEGEHAEVFHDSDPRGDAPPPERRSDGGAP